MMADRAVGAAQKARSKRDEAATRVARAKVRRDKFGDAAAEPDLAWVAVHAPHTPEGREATAALDKLKKPLTQKEKLQAIDTLLDVASPDAAREMRRPARSCPARRRSCTPGRWRSTKSTELRRRGEDVRARGRQARRLRAQGSRLRGPRPRALGQAGRGAEGAQLGHDQVQAEPLQREGELPRRAARARLGQVRRRGERVREVPQELQEEREARRRRLRARARPALVERSEGRAPDAPRALAPRPRRRAEQAQGARGRRRDPRRRSRGRGRPLDRGRSIAAALVGGTGGARAPRLGQRGLAAAPESAAGRDAVADRAEAPERRLAARVDRPRRRRRELPLDPRARGDVGLRRSLVGGALLDVRAALARAAALQGRLDRGERANPFRRRRAPSAGLGSASIRSRSPRRSAPSRTRRRSRTGSSTR